MVKGVRIAVWGEKMVKMILNGIHWEGNNWTEIIRWIYKISDHCRLGTYNVHMLCHSLAVEWKAGTTTF